MRKLVITLVASLLCASLMAMSGLAQDVYTEVADEIDFAGGINEADELSSCSVVEISLEKIIEWNPDIILIHSFSKEPDISVEDVLSDPRLQTVNAVKNGDVYYTKGFYIGWDPASGIAESFYLAKLFHPDLFKDLNVEVKGNEIFEKFYGAPDLYTWMLDSVGNYYRWE